MNEPTNAELVRSLRGRIPLIGDPMEYVVLHPVTAALIADRLEAADAEIARLRAVAGDRPAPEPPDGRRLVTADAARAIDELMAKQGGWR